MHLKKCDNLLKETYKIREIAIALYKHSPLYKEAWVTPELCSGCLTRKCVTAWRGSIPHNIDLTISLLNEVKDGLEQIKKERGIEDTEETTNATF